MKKRIVSLLVALTMLSSVFMTGCGSEESKKSTDDATVSSEAAEKTDESVVASSEEEELEPVTLKVWLPNEGGEDAQMVEDAVNEYLEGVLPNTTVDFEWVTFAEYAEKWSKAMAAREVIDLAWFGWVLDVQNEVNMGSLMPLDDLMAEYGQDITTSVSQQALDLHRSSDGNLYFAVSWQGLLNGRRCFLMLEDTSELMGDGWLDEFETALLDSSDDIAYKDDAAQMKSLAMLEDYLQTAKDNDKLGQGISFTTYRVIESIIRDGQEKMTFLGGTDGFNDVVAAVLVGDTYEIFKADAVGSTQYKILKTYNDFFKKGYIRSDVVSSGLTGKAGSFELPDAYIIYGLAGKVDSYEEQIEASWGVDLDMVYTMSDSWLSPGWDTGTVIPSTSANPERAMMLMNLLYSDPELYQLIVYGIEGTHYTKNEDGTITVQEQKTYKGPDQWTIGSCVNALATNPTMLTYYDEMLELEQSARVSDFAGFVFDTSKVAVEVSNIEAVKKEYEMMFASDDFDSEYQEYIEAMEAAGIDAVLEEAVKQLEAYAATQGRKVKIVDFNAQ